MTNSQKPLILLTNDDGIDSPGLAASAAALDPLGDLLIVAPAKQQSAMGRSLPIFMKGQMEKTIISYGDKSWEGYAAQASPAQCSQFGIIELADRPVILTVSGINFGENVGTGVTISGTVGAALESASLGVPGIAVSLEVDMSLHVDFDNSVDFSSAMYFTRLFASRWLATDTPSDVDVLKIDVPIKATHESEWMVTRLEKKRYYTPTPKVGRKLHEEGRMGYKVSPKLETSSNDTDVAALRDGKVSVTPISLDMTSRVGLDTIHALLNSSKS